MALFDFLKRRKKDVKKHLLNNTTGEGILHLDTHDRQLIKAIFGDVDAPNNQEKYLKTYASNVDIYSIIRKIVQPAASLNYVVKEKRGDTWETIEGTELHELLKKPNQFKNYTWSQYVEMCLTYLLASGNLYQVKQSATGFGVVSLDVLPSAFVEINTRQSFIDPLVNYTLDFDTIRQNFEKEEIIHTKFINPTFKDIESMVYGLSPIQVAAMVAQVGLDRWEADASLLHNKGAIGLLTSRSDIGMTETQATNLQNQWNRDTAGAKNFGKVKVTNKNVDFVQLAMSSTDLQLLEKDVVTLRAGCNVYGVPSVLLNDPGNRTYNNLKEAEKSLWQNAIIPNVNYFLDDFNKDVTSEFFKGREVKLFADYSNIQALQEDINQKAKTYETLINSGVQSPQQAAEAMGLNEPDENASRSASPQNQNN